MTTAQRADLTGNSIKGYDLREKVGAGGFGEVYRAHQALVKREVAVKVILPQYANNPDFVRRFEAEAQLVANLEHLHIVPLYDYWRDQTGAYIVMRWYRGGSLFDILQKGHWPIDDVTRVVDQIGAALAVAHRNHVIHRDLKPANILLDEERNCYLADFGIAKDIGNISEHAEAIAAEEAATDGFVGSPEYISPEQIRDERITERSDIYNMGLLLYEMITGRKPFENLPLSSLITKHLNEPLPEITDTHPDLPDEINEVIARATEKDPEDRYASILDLTADFRQALARTDSAGIEMLTHRTQPAFKLPTDYGMIGDLAIEPDNPYKGLRAFTEADAINFFGRERLVNNLLERLQGDALISRFMAVIGPSGSGKSSVVRAGLLPQLRRGAVAASDDWFYVEMTPGHHPLEELEAALLRVAINPPASLLEQLRADTRGLVRAIKRVLPVDTETELVLFIDQFEETFTQAEDESERAHFLASLAEAANDPNCRLRLLLTLRADFFDRPLVYAAFGQLVSSASVVVLPLSHDELRDAIVRPAENAGLVLDLDLITQIIAEVGDEPGTLPLLQYALTELFERRDGRRLTVEAYAEIGGVTGALARRADDIYAGLAPDEANAARQLFLRLVTLGEGQEDTRRRANLHELFSLEGDDVLMQQVIDLFGQYRLLTFDHDPISRIPTVEVAHEALIRRWGVLRTWLDNSRDDLRSQRRVAQSAAEWLRTEQDDSYLARGTQLEQYEAWSRETHLALTTDEQHYIDASLQARTQRQAAEVARQAREAAIERRSRNILRTLVTVLAIATVGALLLTGFAFNQGQVALDNAATATIAQGEALMQSDIASTQAAIADTNRLDAEANAAQARSIAFVANAQLALNDGNTDQAILFAQQANAEGISNAQTRRVLADAAYAPGTRRVFTEHTARVEAVAYLPVGDRALSAGRDNVLLLLDLATGEVLRTFEGHTDWIYDVQVNAAGDRALTGSVDTTLIEWDLDTGEIVQQFTGHTGPVRAVAYLPDESGVVSIAENGEFFVWDLQAAAIIAQSDAIMSSVRSLAVSPSGFTALTGQDDGSIILWNVQTATPLLTFTAENGGHAAPVWGLDYTPDEAGFVSASEDATLLLWTFEAAQPVVRFEGGHTARVTSVAFDASGTQLASSSEDNTVILWDALTGAVMRQFIGHTFLVYDVAFAPGGDTILSASWDQTVRHWDINHGAQAAQLDAHMDSVRSVVYSDAGDKLVSGGLDGRVLVWDVADKQLTLELTGHNGGVNAVAISPDDRLMASGADDERVLVWDATTGEVLHDLTGHSDAVWALAFSPDGNLIASGSRDNTIILWDANTGEQLNRLFGHTFRISDVEFSPDNRLLLSSSYDQTLILWRLESGDDVRRMAGHDDWVTSATFNSDGSQIVSSSADNTLILWDTLTGEQLRRYEGHTALVNDVRFYADDSVLISASDDSDILVWDAATGEVIQRFSGHTDSVQSLSLAPEGGQLASASNDNSVRVWALRLTIAALNEWIVANRHQRDFTCAEIAIYDLPRPERCVEPTPQVSNSA